jgi:hypothetical protein
VDHASSVGFQRALALHRNPEAATWKFVPLACMCGDLREAYDQSYLLHPPSG